VAGTIAKNVCGAGFDALVKRWYKCISVGGGYVEKCSYQVRISYVSHPFVIHLLTPSYGSLYGIELLLNQWTDRHSQLDNSVFVASPKDG
jgi:hypothetical protein